MRSVVTAATRAARCGLAAMGLAGLGLLLSSPAAAEESEPPARRAGALARVELARFRTSYAHDAEHKARAFNVELGAEAINGKVIAAGATFSFNDAVGERTAAFGYAKSVVLRDGMIAEGTGGGACQVASTLHAAALLGGLDVIARAPHSRPSGYIRMGLDATVALGGHAPAIDLKLKNPAPGPVVIHARAVRGTLEVWLDGAGARPEVSVTSEIVERTAFPRVVERDKRAKDERVRVKAFGIPGYRVRRTREIRAADGTVRRDVRVDVYPPVSEVLEVAPSFDASRLGMPAARVSGDESGAAPPPEPALVFDAAGAVRPALVQLRPSTRVVLDNRGR